MYSLPITTYSDYWRRTKLWSAYFGSLAVLVAGARYSSFDDPDIGKSIKPSLHLVNSLNMPIKKMSGRELFSQGLFERRQISRGLSNSSRGPGELDLLNMSGTNSLENGEALSAVAGASQSWETRTSKIEIIDKELPFQTQYIESDKLLPGTSQIQVKGEKGTRREVVKTFEVGGQPVDQQIQSFFELKSPKNEVILRNTQPVSKKKVVAQKSNTVNTKVELDLSKLTIRKTLNVEATAYTFTGNNTATGVKPREGLIAVDPKVIAMGTKVYVEGYGYAIAADTGGDIRGNKIDVFFSTLRQCMDWGRKTVKIHILDSK